MRLPLPRPIDEVHLADPAALPAALRTWTTPKVVRGLTAGWPLVQAARHADTAAVAYLKRFDHGALPVTATTAAPAAQGRVFYNEDMSGFNFRREQVPLRVVLDTLLKYRDDPDAPTIYVASTTLETYLPGLSAENPLELGQPEPLGSIWIGNRSRIAAHHDVPDNLACVAAGRRRVTLFPPEQVGNLYVGPLDFTPAGQAVSLVDFASPDLQRFPRFAQAMQQAQGAVLEPGDAVFIPSLWWHHMEGLEPFNILVNYWWRQVEAWRDAPMNALMLALLAVRDLPAEQRAGWEAMFRHYVFEADDATAAHVPVSARGVLGTLDASSAAHLRSILRQRLDR